MQSEILYKKLKNIEKEILEIKHQIRLRNTNKKEKKIMNESAVNFLELSQIQNISEISSVDLIRRERKHQ